MASKITCFYAVGLITLLSWITLSDACSAGKYGRDCNLICHCDSNSCNQYSGRCSPKNDCEDGWFGPTCQIRNRAYDKQTTSSQHLNQYSSKEAVDGSHVTAIGSCFHATKSNATQWLQVDLGRVMRIREVWLLNRNYNAQRMRQVTARVGNQTFSPSNPESQAKCYYHRKADTKVSEWLQDSCNQPVVGLYVSVSRPRFTEPSTPKDDWEFDDYGDFIVCELGVAGDPTPKPKPEKVRDLQIRNTTVSEMTVEWNEPSYTNLLLQNYYIDVVSLGSEACNVAQRTIVQTRRKSASKTKHTFSGLEPFTTYEVLVRAATLELEGGGLGMAVNTTSMTGKRAVNSSIIAPSHLESRDRNSSSVTVKWLAPPCQLWGASFEKYEVTVYSNGIKIKTFPVKNRTATQTIVYGLEAYTVYEIRLHFETALTASEGVRISVKTLSDKPSPPTLLKLDGTESNTLVWNTPQLEQLHGEFKGFSVRYTLISICGCDNETRQPEKRDLNETYDASRTVYTLNLGTFLPGSLYMFSVSTRNDWGESDSVNLTTWTQSHKPDPPTNIRGKLDNDTTATFVWEGPQCLNYRGISHQFSWKLEHIENPELSLSHTTTSQNITVTGVVRGGNYSLTVNTSTDYGFSEPATAYVILSDEHASSSSGKSANGGNDIVPIAIAVVVSVLVLCFIIFFVIFWRRGRLHKCLGKTTSRKKNKETQDAEYDGIETVDVQPSAKAKRCKKKKSTEHIALGEKPNTASAGYITVQTPTPSAPVYSEVNNKKSEKKKKASAKGSSSNVYSEVDKKAKKPPLVSKPAKPSKPTKLAQTSAVYSNTPSEAVEPEYISAGLTDNVGIPIHELVDCIAKGKANNCVVFKKEFEKLPKDLIKAANVGKSADNNPRNRFRNIVPYDDSRVVLKDHETDYVNASHIVGFSAQQRYIATQAPSVTTLSDFLALIWQQNVGVVVMLNKPVENGKKRCELYWPEDQDSVKTPGFTVTMTRVEERSHFLVRHLVLARDACGEDGLRDERHVTQYHYTDWPDFGVPVLTSGLVELRNYVREKHGPQLLLVHCTAGVGRTGSFIALDLLLDKSGRLPVWETVDLLRQQRTTMVQTLEQYVFLHDALAEGVVGGHTTFSCPQFSLWVESQGFGVRTEAQFSVLQLMIPEQPYHQRKKDNRPSGVRRFSFAKDASVDIILMGSSGEEELYLSEGKVKPESQEFWEAVVNEEVTTVAFVAAGPERMNRFPGKGERKTIGKAFALECLEEKKLSGSVTEKRLNLDRSAETVYANVKEAEPRTVTVMEITGGDMKDITQVVQLLVQSRKPMLVPDSPALGCVVVGATSAVSHARRLQEVDVYSATKSIILALPALSPTLEQFRLTHQVVAKYLGGNDEYANFR